MQIELFLKPQVHLEHMCSVYPIILIPFTDTATRVILEPYHTRAILYFHHHSNPFK